MYANVDGSAGTPRIASIISGPAFQIGVCLATADHTVNGALATAGVDELFEIYHTIEAALRTLS
jgi:hypothetical protein